jgi:hypothetical protein
MNEKSCLLRCKAIIPLEANRRFRGTSSPKYKPSRILRCKAGQDDCPVGPSVRSHVVSTLYSRGVHPVAHVLNQETKPPFATN